MRKRIHASAESIARQLLLCVIFASSLMWVLWWLVSVEGPKSPGSIQYLARIEKHVQSRFFRTDGYYGSVLVYVTAPFILVAISSFAVVYLRKKSDLKTRRTKGGVKAPRMKLSTYPLIVRSPLGVLTVAEFLFIAGILLLISYSFTRATYVQIKETEILFKLEPELFEASLKVSKLGVAAYCMGRTAMIPFCLLWIPVSRGSPFLRLIRMPFEHAVKYHIWLAMLTLFMLTLHGIGYISYYLAAHKPMEILSWESPAEDCAVVAGCIALTTGLIMWITSLSFFRRRWYEVFFGIHHLYLVFFLFLLYHVMWTVHFIVIPCLLFMVDRFLRMVQSRKHVDVFSAKLMMSGSLHLKVPAARDINSQGLEHHALSSWYLRAPCLSRLRNLQWHFFSVTSTPMDGKEELSFMIKPFGKWTANLKDQIFGSSQVHTIKESCAQCPFSFKVGIEGPYGDETNFFLRYKVLVLIGGGIGVTPLLAIVSDVLHRKKLKQGGLPDSIHIYHCVKKLVELCVLNSVDPNSIVPGYEKQGLKIHVGAYVTSELDTGSPYKNFSEAAELDSREQTILFNSKVHPSGPQPQGVSIISSKGEPLWVACTMIASISGFYILWGLSNIFLVKSSEAGSTNYHRAHLVFGSMILGTAVFGGIMVLAWQLREKWCKKKLKYTPPLPSTSSIDSEMASHGSVLSIPSTTISMTENTPPSVNLHQPILAGVGAVTEKSFEISKKKNSEASIMADKPEATDILLDKVETGSNSLLAHGSPWNGSLLFGCRPDWNEIFTHLNEYQGQDIGVLVSGPPAMREDVAEQCRKHTRVFGKTASSNVFHYHSISFDL